MTTSHIPTATNIHTVAVISALPFPDLVRVLPVPPIAEPPFRVSGLPPAGRIRASSTIYIPAEGSIPMPQQAWSPKRERQYEHIKSGLKEHGRTEDLAEEIAARTVNKERARAGEASEASTTSTEDISSGRRGGLRSHRGPGGRTRDQLYEEAKRRGIKGRSKMSKAQLERAVDR